MKKCANPQCKIKKYGGSLPDDDNYCYECGGELVSDGKEFRCRCGRGLVGCYRFCPGCGLPCEEALKPKPEDEVIITPPEVISITPPEVCPRCGAKMLFIEEFGHDVCPSCDHELIA